MNSWSEVRAEMASVALLGTGRRQLRSWPAELVDEPTGDVDSALLDLAALTRTARLAGSPLPQRAPGDPAPADELADPPAAAVQLLELLIHQNPTTAEQRIHLLREWCHRAAAAGCHLPRQLIEPLLTLAHGNRSLRRGVCATLDERGRWLAQFGQWSWVYRPVDRDELAESADSGESEAQQSPSELESSWATIPTPRRVELLTALRGSDPARARALLESNLAGENARDRLAMLATFKRGLSLADEPLLESLLDDRAITVREQAVALLRTLPGSAYGSRMSERLAALLKVEEPTPAKGLKALAQKLTGATEPARLVAELPGPPDPAGIRDGLPADAPNPGVLLGKVVAATPLSFWLAYGTPEQVIPRLGSVERRAVIEAIQQQADSRWAAAAISDEPGRKVGLLSLVRDESRFALAELVLNSSPGDASLVHQVIRVLDGPWTEKLSRHILTRLVSDSDHRSLSSDFGERIHPAVVPEIQQATATMANTSLRTELTSVTTYLNLRTSIREAF